jgi:kumamolisin
VRYVPLKLSARQPLPGTLYARALPADETLSVSIYLRSRRPRDFSALVRGLYTQPLRRRPHLEVAELAEIYGAGDEDLSRIEEFAERNGLRAATRAVGGRGVRLTGSVDAMQTAFQVRLREYGGRGEEYRGRTGSVHLPADLADVVDAVVGLDDRPVGRSYLRPNVTAASPLQIAQLADVYGFPPQADGTGQTIAVLAFNGREGRREEYLAGGYYPEALDGYFRRVLGDRTLPRMDEVVVHGPGNRPGEGIDPARDTTAEIMMDLQLVGTLAPGARLILYFTEFTEMGWLDALERIIFDAERDPSVLSISYGNPEEAPAVWTDMALREIDRAFAAAALRGITVCAASGDNGSQDSPISTRVYADFPAASPHVLACGGTTLTGDQDSQTGEVAWNDEQGATGGGVSRVFGLPTWQAVAGVPPAANAERTVGRGIPDIAAFADPGVEFVIRNAEDLRSGVGTSIAAPVWAALAARLNEGLGLRVGMLGPQLYGLPRQALRDVVRGDNGTYAAGPGWDACTGLGTPRGQAILKALAAQKQHETTGGEMPQDQPTMIVHGGGITHMIVHGGVDVPRIEIPAAGDAAARARLADSTDGSGGTIVYSFPADGSAGQRLMVQGDRATGAMLRLRDTVNGAPGAHPSPWRTLLASAAAGAAGAAGTAAVTYGRKQWPAVRKWLVKVLSDK